MATEMEARMSDQAKATEGAKVGKYSEEQVAQSREILGREPEGAELAEHHDAPAGGTVFAGPEDDEAAPVAQDEGDGE
jgi:hypothetical protein